ncbi:MAG: acyl--CoA ligase [Myxococcales bacterium]|nr:acyl--CoA ligase [Myxococcales bacterium]
MTHDEAHATVFGPGAPFEISEETVLGERLPVFARRPRSLRDLLAGSAAHGDAEYVVHGDRRISYAENVELVARLARALREQHGVGPGDRVAILAANCPEWILSFWAVVSLGGVAVALNGWWTRDEIEYGIGLAEPRLLIGDAKRLARLEGDDPGVPVVRIEDDFGALLAGPPAELPSHAIAEDDPALILFTSGTTGRPKGALISHRGLVGFVQVTQAVGFYNLLRSGARPDPAAPRNCALLTVPLFHVSGLFSGCILMLASGARTVWRSGKFDAEDVLALIERERVTSWSGLGSMGPRVLNHPRVGEYDLSSLRNLACGGAPVSPAYVRRIVEVAANGKDALGIGYGSSETVATVASQMGNELWDHPDSTGRIHPTVDVEIRDDAGRPLPEGEEGEIHVRSAYLMLGYFRNEEATKSTLKAGRWLATGDIGRLVDGRLYINSRARDMILRAAENVYPVEIEGRIELHPTVREAAVVGVDHPELGQEVKAIVVPEPGQRVDVDALAAWCAESLAPFKVPSLWEVRAAPLPRNAAGKVVKTILTGEGGHAGIEE